MPSAAREPELRLAAQHARAPDASDRTGLHRQPDGREPRADGGQHDEPAFIRHVRRTANDFLNGAARVDGDELQTIPRRVRLDEAHRRNGHPFESGTVSGHAVHGEPGSGELVRQVAGRDVEAGAKLTKPPRKRALGRRF